jgi:beta-exotoxin I transport system permease protein
MTIARRLVRDRWPGARWWALGTVACVATVVALWPTVRGNADVERIVQHLPASVQASIGSQADISLTAAPGYLQARLFSTLLPLLLVVYGIGLGAAAIGGAEEDGAAATTHGSPTTGTTPTSTSTISAAVAPALTAASVCSP